MQRRNRIWIWFFVLLAVLSVVAMTINWRYNQSIQLTPEMLKAAREKWDANGPTNYDLRIRKEINSAANDNAETEMIEVTVRAKRVTEVKLNGRPLEPRLWPKYDVGAWYDYIEEFLERDRAQKTRVYCVLDTAATDGRPLRYVRRVSGTRERQELNFDVKALGR